MFPTRSQYPHQRAAAEEGEQPGGRGRGAAGGRGGGGGLEARAPAEQEARLHARLEDHRHPCAMRFRWTPPFILAYSRSLGC